MKRITIINGMTDRQYDSFENTLNKTLERYGSSVQSKSFAVRDMNIQYCCGCFGCWVKTPGRCVQKDDMPEILKCVINSDLAIFLSPVTMGFVSANIKKVCDKMIPLVHPYIGIFGGECHHYKRYDKYPKLALLLIGDKQKSDNSHRIITDIYKRMAINLKTELAFSILTDGSMEEVEYAINHF